jgi:ribosomal protein S12 methylthiotransferase
MEIQQEISLAKNQSKIGQTLNVLVDRKEGDFFVGRTEWDSPEVDNEVLIKAENVYLRKGEFVHVLIEDATEYDLMGQLV